MKTCQPPAFTKPLSCYKRASQQQPRNFHCCHVIWIGPGDFVAGATLACRISKLLSSANGSAHEYRETVSLLDVVQKVLIQTEQLHATNQLAQSTVNALLFTVNSAAEAMESFLLDFATYRVSLSAGGSGNTIIDAWYKGKWAINVPKKVT